MLINKELYLSSLFGNFPVLFVFLKNLPVELVLYLLSLVQCPGVICDFYSFLLALFTLISKLSEIMVII